MKRNLFMGVSCILFILSSGCSKKYPKEEQIEKVITTNLEKIIEVSNIQSSNPYDYINNEYYNNIVNLGIDAVLVLENMYKSGELLGLNAYLSALIIEDITGCNLYVEYNLDWQNAEEFYDLWENYNCSYQEK